MSGNNRSNNDALESLDFIINVLKEHEKDLDKLINNLAGLTEKVGKNGKLSGQVERVSERLDEIHKEIKDLVTHLIQPVKTLIQPVKTLKQPVKTLKQQKEVIQKQEVGFRGPPVILRCKRWDDFQTLAYQAQTSRHP